jgi:hypothetical protein
VVNTKLDYHLPVQELQTHAEAVISGCVANEEDVVGSVLLPHASVPLALKYLFQGITLRITFVSESAWTARLTPHF